MSVLDVTLNNLMVEASVMLELWGMLSTPLSSLPGPLWPGVVTPEWVLSMGQIELFDILNYANKRLMLTGIVRNKIL